jgi:hypothetical protein
LGEIWAKFGRNLGEIWAKFGRNLGEIWAKFSQTHLFTLIAGKRTSKPHLKNPTLNSPQENGDVCQVWSRRYVFKVHVFNISNI